MQISDLISSPRLTIEMARNRVLQNLQAGQILHAKVLTPSAHNRVQLQIGTAEIIARTQTNLSQGQRIILDVIKTGPLPELRLLQQSGMREVHASALRTILPRQIPLQNLFRSLQQLHTAIAKATPSDLSIQTQPTASNTRQKVGDEVLQLLRSITTESGSMQKTGDRIGPKLLNRVAAILGSTATSGKATFPSTLRQLFIDSGIFLEPKLAAGQPPGNDLKATLLLLLFQIRTAMAQTQQLERPTAPTGEQHNQPQADSATTKLLNLLLRQTEGGLARIQLNQLNSMPPEDGGKPMWQFELPLRHQDGFDSFKVKLEQESSNDAAAQHRWRATINFDLDPLGPVQAQISIQGEEVSALFLTEATESTNLIDQNLPNLDLAFSKAGLKVGHLAAQKSSGVTLEERHPSPRPLLDEKA